MAVLNSGINFRNAPQEIRKRFWGPADTIFFPAGTDLYRFLSPPGWHFDLLTQDATEDPFFPGNRVLSDSWVDCDTFADIARWAHETDLPIAVIAQTGLGVKATWNPSMAEFGWVKLRVPAYGLKGASNRRVFDRYLSGEGITQIWMPNITTDVALPGGRATVEALIPSFADLGKKPSLRSPS
jgi:hypothetical protein